MKLMEMGFIYFCNSGAQSKKLFQKLLRKEFIAH